MGRIVVGADGSPGASAALRWALEEARLRDAELHIVHAWHFPWVVGSGLPGAVALPPSTYDDIAAHEGEVLERAVAEVVGEGESPVRLRKELAEGYAADVLVRASEGADLLVVGSRGHGGFRGLLLGSVSHQCAHHATCPVVIIPHTMED